jgi:hypothetical protein
VNSIFESAIENSKPGDSLVVALTKSGVGLDEKPLECVICKVEYSIHPETNEQLDANLRNEDTDWKNIDKNLSEDVLNLSISRRIIEGQGGLFHVDTSEAGKFQVKFTLPLV